ncbi:FAD-binding oxidoreductase [Sphingomicrobium sp. XHP0239]|uniref:FAD-binding oxidoreductase n=1 Tax=Sphingomicrobium maritimum TaxID=3133972 RepID=UPI0031CC690C
MGNPSAMIEELRGELPARAIVTDAAAIEPWLTDWRGRWTGRAAALLRPDDGAEVAAILRAANRHRVAVVPQGGNSSMVGGATPDKSGEAVILSLRGLDRIEVDAGSRECVVGAGVVLDTLQTRLAEDGLRLPLDLGARGSATVGGLVSTNAGGTEVLRHGTMGEMVRGIDAVMADGTRVNTLSGLKKDNRGPRVDRLMIGAEGLFGVIIAVRLRLVPVPADRATAWVGVASPHRALELLRFLEARMEGIEGFEYMPGDVVAAAQAEFEFKPPIEGPVEHHVLIEAKGSGEPGECRAALEARLAEAIEAGLADDAVVARSEQQSAAMWAIRHHLSDAEKRHFGMANSHDISVPVDAMPDFLVEIAERLEREYPGVSVSGYGHLGDGNIHLHVRAMERASEGWRATEGAAIERTVHDVVQERGGSISAEHGIGQMKRGELARLDPDRVAMLRRLKAAFDPHGILNPGKLI